MINELTKRLAEQFRPMTYQEVAVFLISALLFQMKNQFLGGSCLLAQQAIPTIREPGVPVLPVEIPVSKSVVVVDEKPAEVILSTGDTSDWESGLFTSSYSEQVVHLFEPSVEPYIHRHPNRLFIMFYVPSCEYSTPAKPEFGSAAKELHEEGGQNVTFAAVNCDINIETCKKHNIEGYPTFLLFDKGNYVSEYMDSRLKGNFIAFLKNPPKPSFFSGWF